MRFFNDYGSWRRPDAALSRFKAAILANQPIDIYHQGCHRRDFTYVDDVVEGIVRVFKVPARPDPA